MFDQWPPLTEKDKAELARARERCNASVERRGRFLSAKHRTIGVDVAALDRQVAEKRELEREAKEELGRYNDWERLLERRMNTIVQEQRKEKAEMFRSMKRTWDSQTDRTTRPEWDIQDPKNRFTFQVDHSGNPGSMQGKHAGVLVPDNIGVHRNEDVKEHVKQVQKQHAEDFRKQLEARREEERLQQVEAKAYAVSMDKLLASRARVENDERMERKKRDVAFFEANQGLHEFRMNSQEKDLREKKEAEVAHAENQAASAYLRECRRKEMGTNGKVVRQEWKGMQPEELAAIRRAQIQQTEENQRRREEEKAENARCEKHAYRVGAHARAIHRDMQKERSTEARKLAAVHQKQHEDFQRRQREEREERLRPGISNTWWPFERSDR